MVILAADQRHHYLGHPLKETNYIFLGNGNDVDTGHPGEVIRRTVLILLYQLSYPIPVKYTLIILFSRYPEGLEPPFSQYLALAM